MVKEKKLKLYVFEEFGDGYFDGLAFAIAHNEEEAKNLIIKNMEKDWYNEQKNWGKLKVYPINHHIGIGICGGD